MYTTVYGVCSIYCIVSAFTHINRHLNDFIKYIFAKKKKNLEYLFVLINIKNELFLITRNRLIYV